MAPKSSAAGDAGLVGSPSLPYKRRLNAAPAKVYAAWTDPQKIIRWFGRSDARPGSFQAEIEARVGGHYRVSFATDDEYYEVGGIYRKLCRTKNSCSAGPGIRHRNANRWSR